MELLIPLMPLFGALLSRWQPWSLPRSHELQEVQERLDFAERAVTQQRRLDALPNPLPRPGSGNV